MPELRPDGLIVRIKRGDREALDDFFAAHWMRVHDWLSLEFGVPAGRGADACDVVQDVCLEVFQQIGGFRGETEAEMLAWVRTVLRHRVLDLGRKRILRTFDPSGHSRSTGGIPLPVNQWASNGLTPTEYVLRNESDERATLFRAQLETAIHVSAAYLSNDQRRVLVLREIDGIGLKALAAMLSADSIRTARTYLAAHQSLRQAGRPLFRSTGRAPNEISRRCVMSALESLPPSERDAVLLMQLEGYSMHEASAVLETTKTAIGARVYRGMHCLQRFFDARGAVGGK